MRAAIFVFSLILLYPFKVYAACDPEKVSFSGSVKEGQEYSHAISSGLIFYLDPSETGWIMRISGPRAPKFDDYDENYIDYIYPVTPPYRMNPVQYLDDSYGQETIDAGDIREFSFLLNAEDSITAEHALQKILWPKIDTDQENGLAIIDTLPKAEGVLTITAAKSTKADDITKYTRISFKFESTLPSGTRCK